MVADVATKQAHEVWHNQPNERLFTKINNMRWAGDNIVFPFAPPNDEFDRYYSISLASPQQAPIQLTTTDWLIEDNTSVAFSSDGKTLYYCTNAKDIERRHIWAVSTSGGAPAQVSTGDGIETYPAPLASGKKVAVLYFNARQPASVALVPAEGGEPKIISPALPKDFPAAAHVVPQIVLTKAADGLEIHNQLFLPADLKPGEKRPAIIFVHGGPQREMLPGYHYMQFYRATCSWLRSAISIRRLYARASSRGERSSRWTFSMRAISSFSSAVNVRSTTGIFSRPAIRAARTRRSPATMM